MGENAMNQIDWQWMGVLGRALGFEIYMYI